MSSTVTHLGAYLSRQHFVENESERIERARAAIRRLRNEVQEALDLEEQRIAEHQARAARLETSIRLLDTHEQLLGTPAERGRLSS